MILLLLALAQQPIPNAPVFSPENIKYVCSQPQTEQNTKIRKLLKCDEKKK